ncbi:MAG TPA: copper-binding protein [Terriglobales bacterium]|nr:copper-binding protein [Terriglobales bacterium]
MSFRYPAVLKLFLIAAWISFAVACRNKAEVKRYPMTGTVVAVHQDSQTVTVRNDNMPGFMPPMDMDYRLQNTQSLAALKSGDKIKGTIVVQQPNPIQLDDVTIVGR